MSLVNDMLRDLNRRKSLPVQVTRVNGAIDTSFRKRSDSRVGFVLLIGVIAGLGGGYAYFSSTSQVVTPAVPPPQAIIPAPVAQPVAAPVPEVTAPVEAAKKKLLITEEAISPMGYTLRLTASERVDFTVSERDANGLKLHLSDIETYDRGNTTIEGMSVMLAPNGADLGFEHAAPADFLVYEDVDTEQFDIVLSATYRPVAEVASALPQQQEQVMLAPELSVQDQALVAAAQAFDAQTLSQLQNEAAQLDVPAAQTAAPTVPASERSVPVRTTRQLTLEEQDRSTSQTAISMVQGGRLFEAYERLLTFISANPSAHQSRETLATVLLAQQEFVQAQVVIDEGLTVAPNHAPFKKIKARLLMRNSDPNAALQLLREVPPPLASDVEYHELLASLYQQTGNHQLAIGSYQELLRFNGQVGRWWAGLGVSLEAQGNKTGALSSYQAALQAADLDGNLRQYSQSRIRSLGEQQ